MNGMYSKFAADISKELFDSVYSDLYQMAKDQQSQLWNASRSKKKGAPAYSTGEHQDTLNSWCKGKLSLGEALDYIKIYKNKD